MRAKQFLLSTAMAVGIACLVAASAANAGNVAPVSYTFDQPNNCGSWCYYDTSPPSKLTNGLVGDAGWAVNQGQEWDGWEASSVNIDFNFGSVKSISTVSVGSTQDDPGDVVLPSLKIYSSNDGSNWTLDGSLVVPVSNANNNSPYDTSPHGWLTLSGLGIDAKYVRVQAINNGPWIFIDEVTFAGAGGVPEPATWAMLILGLGGVGVALRRRKVVLAA